ncbi:MAG: maleylpyruvate isomerase N-terminal domain-containing protein [Angustibacter sp.]
MSAPTPDRSSWLTHEAYLEAFAVDADRLSQLARSADPETAVPTCPGWTLLDLVRHVGDVYAHKVALLRLGRRPEQGEWPLGDDLPFAAAVDRHDAVQRELAGLLAEVGPDTACWTWMEGAGEGTSAAWARRMAHEALVHRVDAEAAVGAPLHPAAPGLAADGVDEVLTWMAGDPDVVAEPQSASGAPGTVLLDWGSGGRLVDLPDGGHAVRALSSADVADVDDRAADATLRGDALSLDLYLWGRLEALPAVMRGDLDVVEVSGSAPVLERLSARVAAATQ